MAFVGGAVSRYAHVNTTTGNGAGQGTEINAGPTRFQAIVANITGDADWTVKVYDGTDATGSVVAVCDCNTGGNYVYEVDLMNGIYIQTYFSAAGTKAGDITIVYS